MEENKEEKAREMFMEFQSLEQNIKQLQKQLEMITGQMIELTATNSSLDEFANVDIKKEVFVPLNSGIFAKASINNTQELLVNVGANVAVKKDVASTKKLISKQVDEIRKIQGQMIDELEKMTNRAAELEATIQGLVSSE